MLLRQASTGLGLYFQIHPRGDRDVFWGQSDMDLTRRQITEGSHEETQAIPRARVAAREPRALWPVPPWRTTTDPAADGGARHRARCTAAPAVPYDGAAPAPGQGPHRGGWTVRGLPG